jgi:hypothetical protein
MISVLGTRSGPRAPGRAGNGVRMPAFEVSLFPCCGSEALQWHCDYRTVLPVE